jgi:type III restriction enzyme
MALHKDFPRSPYEILNPDIRWFPADEQLREQGYDKLLPPLVTTLRNKVREWRENSYEGASETSVNLLNWWFKTEHFIPKGDGTTAEFKYYFAQREAVETIIYLHDVAKVKDKYDLMKFVTPQLAEMVSIGHFPEDWRRFVIKMGTGTGKTKVMSLILAWAYFHKIYEPDSDLARNFLLITPNIIVLDRIRTDFDGLKIFYQDPILPDNGYGGRDWHTDFQLTVHIQDNVNITKKVGNLFITNIHRVFDRNSTEPSFSDDDTSDYFLGSKPVQSTNDSTIDLDQIVRDIDELVILNDEAHHIHNPSLAWFKSIEDISNNLKQKGTQLALQIDVTATPKHNNGAIFVQTVSDYPLVEAIYQNVVKHPVLPDSASRGKLVERKSSKYTERYEDYIELGYQEWKKASEEHDKLGKKSIFFVMTDDTKNCDDVSEYLESRYPEFKGAVLTIHTKNNGDISESTKGRNKEELELLRKASNEIDNLDSPYKAIVSVLMLKEGWDVKNVTTIVGLRAYSSKSNILPEQTLGRGLRRMYRGESDVSEYVSIVGTPAFMDFVESIKNEGVELEKASMGTGSKPKAPLVIEVDKEDMKKDIEKLDIDLPILIPRIYREYKNLSQLDLGSFKHKKLKVKEYSEEEKRDIVFKNVIRKDDTEEEVHHITKLDTNLVPDYSSVVGFFAQSIKNELRLVGGYDILYGKVKNFMKEYLFEEEVNLEDLNTLRNLSETEASRTIVETFKSEINKLTVVDKGETEIKDYIKISKTRPFIVKDQGYIIPQKSVFNKIVGDSHFELQFANFLEGCEDITSYAKNYLGVHFKIDYQTADNSIADYYTDFIVKVNDYKVYFVETKGFEDLDATLKIKRLKQWCNDINSLQGDVKYDCLYVKQDAFDRYRPKNFKETIDMFLFELKENT